MATKGPPRKPGFASAAEKQKWDKIQNAGDKTIKEMLDGRATPEAIKSLGNIIAEQHSTAGKIFEEGIKAIEHASAATVDKMNDDRVQHGKHELTPKAYERVLQRVFQQTLSDSSSDLLGQIYDFFEKEFTENRAKIQKMIDEGFQRLRDQAKTTQAPSQSAVVAKPKGLQTPQSPLQRFIKENAPAAANDVAPPTAANDQTYKRTMAQRLKPLIDFIKADMQATMKSGMKMLDKFRSFFTSDNPRPSDAGRNSVLNGLRRFIQSRAKAGVLDKADKPEKDNVLDAKGPTMLDKLKRFAGHSLKDLEKAKKDKAHKAEIKKLAKSKYKTLAQLGTDMGIQRKTDVISSATAAHEAYFKSDEFQKLTPEQQKKKKESDTLEKCIAKALKDNDALKAKAIGQWGKITDARGEYEQSKDQDSWLRKIRGFIGGDASKKKESSSWFSTLLKILATALLNPQLLTTITDAVEKYLNWDSISKFLSDTWDTLKAAGSKLMDWIIEQVKDFNDTKKYIKGTQEKSVGDVQTQMGKMVEMAHISSDTTVEQAKQGVVTETNALQQSQSNLAKAQEELKKNQNSDDAWKYKNKVAMEQANVDIHTKKLQQYKDVMAGKAPPSSGTSQTAPAAVAAPSTPASDGKSSSTSVAGSGGSASASSSGSSMGSGGPAPAGGGSSSAPPPSSSPTPTADSSTAAAAAASSSSSSAAASSPAPTAVAATQQSKTEVESVGKPSYAPGVAVDANPAPAAAPTADAGKTGAAGSTVGINSFGFTSGDDSLNVLNLRMMT